MREFNQHVFAALDLMEASDEVYMEADRRLRALCDGAGGPMPHYML